MSASSPESDDVLNTIIHFSNDGLVYNGDQKTHRPLPETMLDIKIKFKQPLKYYFNK